MYETSKWKFPIAPYWIDSCTHESIHWDTDESIQTESESVHGDADESIQYETESILHDVDESIHHRDESIQTDWFNVSWQITWMPFSLYISQLGT